MYFTENVLLRKNVAGTKRQTCKIQNCKYCIKCATAIDGEQSKCTLLKSKCTLTNLLLYDKCVII